MATLYVNHIGIRKSAFSFLVMKHKVLEQAACVCWSKLGKYVLEMVDTGSVPILSPLHM